MRGTLLPTEDALPVDLSEALAPLPLLDDAALWRAARSHLTAEIATELEQLHLKQQREGLTEAETRNLAHLVRQYERAMLIRAQAAAILKERGHDVEPGCYSMSHITLNLNRASLVKARQAWVAVGWRPPED